MVVRLALLLVVALVAALVAALVFQALVRSAGGAVARRRPARTARSPRPGGYDWDRRRDQLYRQVKGISGSGEDREGILEFIDSHRGVEAYVEPRTVINPLSVVLVAGDGTWRRFELREDAFLRELTKTRGLRVFDAARVGYPERMKRRPPANDERNGSPEDGT